MCYFIISNSPHPTHFLLGFRESHKAIGQRHCQSPASKSPFYLGGWVSKIITKSVTNSFICSPVCPWLLDYHSSLPYQNLSNKRTVVHCIFFKLYNNITWKSSSTLKWTLLSCTLGLHTSVCRICMFALCIYVCVWRPLLINVTSYCNGACWTCPDICNVLPASAWFYCHGLIGYYHDHNLD